MTAGTPPNPFRYNLSDTQSLGYPIYGYINDTRPQPRTFAPEKTVILSDGSCGSTCAVFAECMKSQIGPQAIVVGGRKQFGPMHCIGGSKGANNQEFDILATRMNGIYAQANSEERERFEPFVDAGADGCDATARTSVDSAGVLGRQPGLDGHNRFEAVTSERSDDFFFYGDVSTFNGSPFHSTYEHAQEFGGRLFNRDAISASRAKRYDDSLATNPNFYFGPRALLLYGAPSFIYNAFPGSTAEPDLENTATFFGAVGNGDGRWSK